MAWSHFRKREFQKAIEDFQRMVRSYPESPFVPSALLKMGDAYYNLKQYSSAVRSYSRVVKDYSKSKEAPEADFGILLSLFQEKKQDAIVAQVDDLVKRYPQHPLASQALMQLGTSSSNPNGGEGDEDIPGVDSALSSKWMDGGRPVSTGPSAEAGETMGGGD